MRLPKAFRVQRSVTSLAPVSLVLALIALPGRAEVDKEKADEKAKKEAEGQLGGEGSEEFDKLHQKLVDDGEQNLREIHELMKKIQDDLANKQTGDPIQKRQQNLIEKIEDLIRKFLEQTQQGSSSSSQQQQNQQPRDGQSQEDQKQGGRQQQNKRDAKMKPGQQDQKRGQDQQTASDGEREKYGPTRHDRASEGKLPPAKPSSLHDILRTNKQWGLLPEKLQDVVRSSKGKELPSEYKELISDYYKRLSDVLVEKKED